MNQILFNVKDNKLNVNVRDEISNRQFLESLKTRLQKLVVVKEDLIKNVVLNIKERKLDNRETLEMFDILNEFNVFYLSEINCKKLADDAITIYKGNLRSGQIKSFHKSLILIGNINKGSKVIVNGNLYVLGMISGEVWIKSKHARIYCETIKEALVKIGNVYKYYEGELNSKEIYLDNETLTEKGYKKGVMENGKSNSCYIG